MIEGVISTDTNICISFIHFCVYMCVFFRHGSLGGKLVSGGNRGNWRKIMIKGGREVT